MNPMLEKHYTPPELAKHWGMSADSIRALFETEPDVLKLDRPEQRYKRGYTSYYIPESVARRVYARLTTTPRCATRRKAAAIRQKPLGCDSLSNENRTAT